MKSSFKYIIILLGLLAMLKGTLQLVDSNYMPESSELGGFAVWASGIIFIITGMLVFIIGIVLHYKQ